MRMLSRSGIKFKIIITFSILVTLLVFSLSRISYLFVRNIYLEQLYDHISEMSHMISDNLDTKYLNLVGNNNKTLAASMYRDELLQSAERLKLNNAFIFDRELDIVVAARSGISTTRLQLNRKEIRELQPGMFTSSLPFKGQDNKWYLWTFQRLDDQYFLGIQESVDRLSRLDDLSRIFILIGFIGFGLTVLSGWFLAGTIARPIDKLVSFSAQIGRGDFKSEPPSKINGELQILNDALVKMRDDLVRIHQERESMLAQVAHEIRNPLGGIELLTGLIREDIDAGSKNALYAGKIQEEVSALKNQINAYLSFSRPVEVQPEKVPLAELFETIKRDFQQKLHSKQISLEIETHLPYIRFDPGHLRQILNNLIANSIQVLDEKGRITVTSAKEDGLPCVAVSDNGPGINGEHITRIFDPFYTTHEEGTGLGLAICRKLARENNADITVKNNLKNGCTFYLTINT